MESANLHQQQQHQLQDHLDAVDASLATPYCYGDGSNYDWLPNITLNAGNINPKYEEAIPNARDLMLKNNATKFPPYNNFLIQDLGYQWINGDDRGSCLRNEPSPRELPEIKEESNISSDTCPRFSDIINSSSSIMKYTISQTRNHIKSNHMDLNTSVTDNSDACFHGVGMTSRGNFSQFYPSVNTSSQLNPPFSATPRLLDMNMQASNSLFNSTAKGVGGSLRKRYSHNDLSKLTDHLQLQANHRSPYGSDSTLANGVTETKRPSISVEPKASSSSTAPNKKSRLLESRAPCPHFKVRKEKVGDRIATLQQLVAPFGKTDTASVLMEAIGYIKFLHNQVETLSVPYMKSRSDQRGRALQGDTNAEDKREGKRDLRSRGLCLVPLSCMTYITGEAEASNGGFWQHTHFGAGTL